MFMAAVRRHALVAVLTVLALAFAGFGPATASDEVRPGAEARFVQIDPIDYEMVVRKPKREDIVVPFTTSTSRIFYTLQPAEVNPDTAPLFVFLNGGPGAATTANFFANNTSPYTLYKSSADKDPAGVVKNPNSWTSIANLLYIDPAQSGFSYNVSEQVFEDPEYGSVLSQLWNEYWARGNLNPFIDADQILRVILTFLKEHPEFTNREVVMVGESYGGVRVSTILHMLMNSGMYDSKGSSFFHDPGLAAMIREHFGTGADTPSIEKVTGQFKRQILVQPQLSSYQGEVTGEMYWDTKPSIIDRVAEDAKSRWGFTRNWARCAAHIPPMLDKETCPIMVYLPQWGRDRYDYAMKDDYSDIQDAYTNESMRNVARLQTMLGVAPATIVGLQPAQRTNAYHTIGFPVIGDDERPTNDKNTLAGLFGTLNAPDSYYVAWNQYAYLAATQPYGSYTRINLPLSADSDPLYGEMFLQNLQHVQTFLTNALRDLVIYSPALPEALKRHDGLVKGVTTTYEMPDRAGQLIVTWKDGTTSAITWPTYAYAGHAVAMTMPDKLLADVTSWIAGAGAGGREYVKWSPGTKQLSQLKANGVRVVLRQPAATSRAAWLFPADASKTKGAMVWRHGKKKVVLRLLDVGKSKVTAVVDGSRVRVLRVRSGDAKLAPEVAKVLRSELGVGILRAGMPLGRVVHKRAA
jgi:hypothetical protein